jgi:hypothetical protein
MQKMDQLQATCLALLLSTQSHPVGFSVLEVAGGTGDTPSLASLLSEREQQLLALHDKLLSVTLQRRTLEAELAAARAGGTGIYLFVLWATLVSFGGIVTWVGSG